MRGRRSKPTVEVKPATPAAPDEEAATEKTDQVEVETTEEATTASASDGDIYQYVANPTDIIDTVAPTQYYEGEELIASALTDEDRKLAAALVDVHYKNQQAPATEAITTSVDDNGTTYTIQTAEDAEVEAFIKQQEEEEEATEKSKEIETKKRQIVVSAKNQPGTRIIFKSEAQLKASPVPAKKSLPHKKRGSGAAPANIKNVKTYVSCAQCGDLFTSEAELNTHKMNDHGIKVKASKVKTPKKAEAETKPFSCQLCTAAFSDQMTFFEHLKSHYEPKKDSEEPKIEVEEVDNEDIRVYDDTTATVVYEEKDEDQNPVVKTVYVTETSHGLEFEGAPLMKPKRGAGVNKTIYQCGECNKQFKSPKSMENHMRCAHFKFPEEFSEPEDTMVLDEKSNIVIRSWSPLGTTLLSQESHPSSYLTSGYAAALDSNMTSQEYESFETINVQLDGTNLDGADAKTISVTLVPIHEASAEGEIIAASSNEDWKGTVVLLEDKDAIPKKRKRAGPKREKKRLICEYCNREFKYRNTLVYHLRSHTGEKPHVCEGCGKKFFTSTALKVHSRIHEGVKPYACEICGRAFRQWGDLKYHRISLHTDLKAYQCEFCGKDFARKYSMIVHRRIHTGERNYVCEFCNKAFRASSYLQNHRRIHTGEKPHFCPVCNKLFRVRSDMKRHLNTHNVDAAKFLTVTGKQTGPMQSRIKKEPKVVYDTYEEIHQEISEELVQPSEGGGGKRRKPATTEDSEPFSDDDSDENDMEVVQNEEDEDVHQGQAQLEQSQIHHMEEVYTSKGMYVWVDE